MGTPRFSQVNQALRYSKYSAEVVRERSSWSANHSMMSWWETVTGFTARSLANLSTVQARTAAVRSASRAALCQVTHSPSFGSQKSAGLVFAKRC